MPLSRMIGTGRALLSSGAGADPNAALNASLLSKVTSYWKLDEASGSRADSVGTNTLAVNGTVGVGSAAGKLSNAASFVGANSQYLNIADNASISIGNNSFEWCFWINPSVALGGGVDVIQKRSDYTVIATATLVQFVVWVGAATKVVNKNTAIPTDTWSFISVAFDKDAQLISADVNNSGTRPATATSGATIDDGVNPLSFGARPGIAFLTGMMDEVFFCKGSILTAAERTLLYNSGNAYNGFLP